MKIHENPGFFIYDSALGFHTAWSSRTENIILLPATKNKPSEFDFYTFGDNLTALGDNSLCSFPLGNG
jgi:hypothetical protein